MLFAASRLARRPAHRPAVPAFEILEERLMLAAQPVAGIDGGGDVPIGEQTTVTVTFDNQPDGSPGGDVGFGPYIDLVLPQNGADGAGVGSVAPNENDGVTFAGATFLGQPLSATVIEFDAAGQAIHPFARDATGALRVVNAADYGAAAGDQLVVLQLPFGSFTSDQTPARISVQLDTSNLADAGVPLPITAVGGFSFGRDPLNNPTVDPPVLGAPSSTTVTPTVASLTKTFSGPEGETATGPNFPRSYTLSLDVAEGQTLTDLQLLDQLPDGIVVTGTSIVSGPAGSVDFDPATNDLTVDFTAPLIGAAGADVLVRVDFYVGEFMAPGDPTTPVLDPVTGADRALANDLAASFTWDPIDDRDPEVDLTIDPTGPENVFVAKPLAIQKSVTDLNGGASEPGDTVRWTISAQLSDYFSVGGVVLNDTLSDGQVTTAALPVLTLRSGGTVLFTGAFDPANVDITANPDGTTSLQFRVSDELALRGIDPTLAGGLVGAPAGATTFDIAYESTIQRFYADGRPLLQGDGLGNAIGGGGTLPGSGNSIDDDSAAGLVLDRGQALSKGVYLINGAPPTVPSPAVTNSDTVTFRLQYTLPTGSVNTFTLTDFLPLPMLLAQADGGGPLTFLDIRDDGLDPSTIPPVGSAWFHPDETFDLANPTGYAGAPTITLNAAANSITFDFGSFFVDPATPLEVDVLFRLRVQDVAFADNLLVTNQVTSREANTAGTVVEQNAIAQILITQPQLNLGKGVVGVTTGQTTFPITFDPATVAPLPFAPPGSAGAPFGPPLTTAALADRPIDSDLSGVDAGDLVRFAIVVENTGRGIRGAHDILIRDTLPAGFEIPAGGLNLTVTRGDGTVIAIRAGGDLFGAGIELLDPTDLDATNREGALTRFTLTSPDPGVPPTAPTGSNLAVITYDLRVAPDAQTGGLVMTNTAEIARYAAQDGGNDFAVNLLPGERFDDATVTTGDPLLVKDLIATSFPQSTGSQVLIGEEATFRVVLSIREGQTRDLVLSDFLPVTPGVLTLVDWRLVGLGANLAFSGSAPPLDTPQGDPISISLGDVLNSADNVFDAADRVVLEVRARVDDLAGNSRGDVLVNTATATFTDPQGITRTLQDTESVTIVEPGPLLTKTVVPTSVDGGDSVTYTVTLTNPAAGGVTAPLFDVVLVDLFEDADLAYVPGSVLLSGTAAAGATVAIGGPGDPTIRVLLPQLDPGATLILTYRGRIADAVESSTTVRNVAAATGDSAPGDIPGQRPYAVADDAVVSVSGPRIGKAVIDTGLADTGTSQGDPARSDLAYGETVTFRLRTTFAEGVTTSVELRDLLPIAPQRLEALSATITAVGTNLSAPGAVLGATGTLSDRNGDGLNDTVVFSLGTVVNAPDGTVDPRDRIDVVIVARLITDGVGPGGQTLVNTGTLSFLSDGVPRTATATTAVETVAPRLAIDKTATPTLVDGGDVVTYSVRVTNSAGAFAAPAYDFTIRDLLDDPNLSLVAGTVSLSGAPGSILDGSDPGDTDVVAGVPRLLVGGSVLLTYQARVADLVPAGTRLDNTAAYVADSHPGPTPGEQSFAGSDLASVQTTSPALAKAVIATALPETGSGAFDPTLPDLAIGETVTYRLTLTLPEGTSPALRVVDQLPTGAGVLQFLAYSIPSLSVGTNLSFVPGTETATLVDSDGDGRVDRIELGLGTVTNTPDGVVDDGDRIAVEIVARLVNVPANAAGDRLTNVAQAFLGPVALTPVTAVVEAVEPSLAIVKAPVAGPGVPTGDAGDEIAWRLTVASAPGASGPAYELRLTDLIPTGATIVAGSVATDRGSVVAGNAPGDTSIVVDLGSAPLLPTDDPATAGVDESRVVVTYVVRLADSVEPGQILTNTVDFAALSAPTAVAGGEARAYAGATTGTTAVVMPITFDKAIVATSNPDTGSAAFDPANPDVAVGETITYRLTATLSEGTQTLVVADTLPSGLEFVGASVVSVGAGLPAGLAGTVATVIGSAVRFDFGTVVNAGNNVAGDGVVAVEIVARVADVAGNQAGTVLANAGSVTVTSPSNPGAPGGTQTAGGATAADVVAPDLVLDKSAPAGFVRPGDPVDYTLTLRHAPGSTAPAYDLVLADPLADADLVLQAGSVVASIGGAGVPVSVGNAPGDTSIRIDLARLTPGEVLTVTYRVIAAAGAPGGGTIVNTASAGYDSNPGPGGRPGSVDDAASVPLAPGFEKVVSGSSLPETVGGDVAIGERVTYDLTVTLPQGAVDDLVVTDALPVGLRALSASVVQVGSGITGALLAPGAPGTIAGQTIRFDFGDVVNGSDDAIDDADRIVLRIEAVVEDVGGNVDGVVLPNDARLSYVIGGEAGGEEAVAPIEVVEPALSIVKDVTPGAGDAGDVFTYTVTVAPLPAGTGPAYDVVVTDVLDPLLVPVGVSSTVGTVTLNGQEVRLSIPVLLPTAAPVVLTYQVRFADAIEPGQVVDNEAALVYDSLPGPGGREQTGTDGASVTSAFDISLVKEIVDTSLPETGSGFFDPTLPDVAIGETVTYEVTTTLGEGTQIVFLRDVLPEGLALVPGTLTVQTGASIVAGAGGTLTPAAIVAGQTVSFDFGTLINAGDNVVDDGDRIVLRFTAVALDVPLNVAGRDFTNAADVTVRAPSNPGAPGGTLTADDDATAEIVTAVLRLEKSVDAPGGDAGDEFTYTLTLDHLTPFSTAPAFEVRILDPLPSALVLDPTSIATSFGSAVADGNTLRIDIPVLLPEDAVVTVTYRARFADSIEPGQVVPNVAEVRYSSAPGDISRPGAEDATAAVVGAFDLSLAKSIVATSIPETGSGFFDPARPDLAIGETVTYRIVATIGEGTQRLIVGDVLPAGLVPLSVLVTAVGGGVPAALVGTAGTISGQAVEVDLGTIVNPGDNAGPDTVTIDVVARLADVAGNQAGVTLVNQATATASSPSDPDAPGGTLVAGATTGADVVAPLLIIDKSVDSTVVVAGEAITYTITVAHASQSTAPAFDVLVTDTLAGSGLVLEAGSVATDAGAVVGDGTTVQVLIDRLPVGQVVTITYRAVAPTAPDDGVVPNTAAFIAASSPDGPAGFVRAFGGSDDAAVSVIGGGISDRFGGFAADGGLFDDLAEGPDRAAPFTLPPIYSGIAAPGAQVTLQVADALGGTIGTETRVTDVGGNWLVSLPGLASPPPPRETTATLLSETPLFAERDLGLGATLPQVTRPESANIAGDAVIVAVQQTNPLSAAPAAAADSTRVYFAGPASPYTFGAGAVDQLFGARAGGISAAVPDVAAVSRPFGLALNKFAMEFLAGSTVPSGPLS